MSSGLEMAEISNDDFKDSCTTEMVDCSVVVVSVEQSDLVCFESTALYL